MVSVSLDGSFKATGVVVNNPRCVLVTAHQTEEGNAFLNLDAHEFTVNTSANYLNNAQGSSIKVSQIIRHPSRTSPGSGTDAAIFILETDLPGAKPAKIATTAPTSGTILKLIGYGQP